MKQNNKPKIHPVIRQRWSPRSFKHGMVTEEKLMAVIEAGRWAASAFNEQLTYTCSRTLWRDHDNIDVIWWNYTCLLFVNN